MFNCRSVYNLSCKYFWSDNIPSKWLDCSPSRNIQCYSRYCCCSRNSTCLSSLSDWNCWADKSWNWGCLFSYWYYKHSNFVSTFSQTHFNQQTPWAVDLVEGRIKRSKHFVILKHFCYFLVSVFFTVLDKQVCLVIFSRSPQLFFLHKVGCALNVLGFGESICGWVRQQVKSEPLKLFVSSRLLGLQNNEWAVRGFAALAVILLGTINVLGVSKRRT